MIVSSPQSRTDRSVPLAAILLLALAVHVPLLLMQLPLNSYDANTHIFFASHYADHWFNPWNEKWYAGFSQTTYPPLTHQWIGLMSHLMGLNLAYMFVQLVAILLLVAGVYRWARLWVSERAAGYAALGAVFLGSLAMLVYQSGQLPTTMGTALTINALPYFYRWLRNGQFSGFLKALAITAAAGAAHHVTLLFGAVLFFLPVLWSAFQRRSSDESEAASVFGVGTRAILFAAFAALLLGVVLLPYWIALLKNPITQMPIPHGSRDNYILNPLSGINFWVIPMGALILALPFVFFRGWSERRLTPLFLFFYLTLLIGLGGTTPVAHILLGRAFQVLTFERFTFWATLMTLPIVGLMAVEVIERHQKKAIVGLWIGAVVTFSMAVAWTVFRPIGSTPFRIDEVEAFLNREEHSKFRYITLGFGNQFSRLSSHVQAASVDGDYNSARLLPELTAYGSGQLYNSKYFGAAGMESLRAVLKHANQYGLKYIFVRDRFYEPLLAFAGWRQAEVYDGGNVTLWTKDDVQPAKNVEAGAMVPSAWQGLLWGTLPLASSLVALLLVLIIPEQRRLARTVEFPAAVEPVTLREAR